MTLVVIDEAHRATGNYAYCTSIRHMIEKNCVFRVLALSATPGSDTKGVQNVVNNILIEKVEIRTEMSMDIQSYIFSRDIKEVIVEVSPLIEEINDLFMSTYETILKRLQQFKVFSYTNAANVSSYSIMIARDRLSI